MALAPTNLVLLALLAACAPGMLGMGLLSRRRTTLSRLRTVMGDLGAAPQPNNLLRFLQWLGANLPGASDGTLHNALASAGYFLPSALPIFVALRLGATIGAFLLVLHVEGHATMGIFFAVFAAFFVSRLFVVLLKLAAEARQRAIRRELPPLVDILLMVLNSGVSIDQCLRYVTTLLERAAPRTSLVFKRYVSDIDSGMPYEAAFERLGQRLGIDEGYDLANLIKQALLQGGEIMTSLEQFGAELTDKRVATAREQIGRKSVILTMVMLAFFMPVLMIALAGPAVSNITETLAAVKQQTHSKGARP